ncbi:hypothetical protein acsn021_30180 [Anaerocolumna cellulosilytica]|uniref:Uncharacterized protein n=1 Tax=Anaerocolumna cellulosilytica TaxID=433286 RepID=A0A6S6R282_9FIRM|nr:ribonuclease H-like domain-containing protein [Anaerocolumna cellulosilytica]MBB5197430.1 hypothetical protein [Anaerocolumna cellulosilytica]BCJ95449.1 hypothetical protein acsn021_30180 [Anaerocolumna cellulosilytica]
MYTTTQDICIEQYYPYHFGYSLTEIIFFDIETTGFSAKTSFVYLIGCMYYKDNTWRLTQWLTEDIVSEKKLLETFITFLNEYKLIIHYNGTGFDIPYLAGKCTKYQLNNPFNVIESFDIYKKLLPLKKLLPTANLKLKTMEEFINLKRQDTFSGEELIQIYANYLGKLQSEKLRSKQPSTGLSSYQEITATHDTQSHTTSAEEVRAQILLHNYEDVKNLLPLGNLLYFAALFQENSWAWSKEATKTPNTFRIEEYWEEKTCLHIMLQHPITLPSFSLTVPLPNFSNEEGVQQIELSNFMTLSVKKDGFYLDIPILQGELKHFFPNYRDYFFLPLEDRAIHKSVAQFVDKEYREKAKPANCYVKESGYYLPQTEYLFSPVFQYSNKDKITFFETANPDFKVPANKEKYIKSILHYIIQNKNITVNS